ncbi:MAG: hypothetical protein ACKO8Y_04390, partial [Actinomycetota bacterium]
MRLKPILLAVTLTVAAPLIAIGFNLAQLWSTYNKLSDSKLSREQLIEVGDDLHRDTEDLLRYLSLPVIKQLSQLAGLEVFDIKPEILFSVKHLPELAGFDRPK